jgi:hypothetical protein
MIRQALMGKSEAQDELGNTAGIMSHFNRDQIIRALMEHRSQVADGSSSTFRR